MPIRVGDGPLVILEVLFELHLGKHGHPWFGDNKVGGGVEIELTKPGSTILNMSWLFSLYSMLKKNTGYFCWSIAPVLS